MKKNKYPEQIFVPKMPNYEAMKREHCLCFTCRHHGICQYCSEFIDYQQTHFPAKIDCYKYEREHLVTNSIFETEKEN